MPLHPDGFALSEEQDFILRSVETAILGDDRPTLCRFVVEAVAGSGKTTLLEAMLLLIGRLSALAWPQRRSTSTFRPAQGDSHPAQGRRFRGAQIIGDSNGVQAAGRRSSG